MTASVSIDPAVRREVQSDYFRYLLPTLIGQIAHSFYCMQMCSLWGRLWAAMAWLP